MPQIRTKIENKTIAWDARRRFRVGSSCEYNGSSWVNVTGGNSEPGVGNDWVKKEGSGGSLMIHSITVETAGPNQVFTLPDTFSQIQLVNSRVPLTKGTEWEEMFPNQVKIITELEIGDALEVHFWKRGSNNSESYTKAESLSKAETIALNNETFKSLKSVNGKLSFATEALAQSYWAGLTAQEQADINLQEFAVETGTNAGVNKWDSTAPNGTAFLRKNNYDSEISNIKNAFTNRPYFNAASSSSLMTGEVEALKVLKKFVIEYKDDFKKDDVWKLRAFSNNHSAPFEYYIELRNDTSDFEISHNFSASERTAGYAEWSINQAGFEQAKVKVWFDYSLTTSTGLLVSSINTSNIIISASRSVVDLSGLRSDADNLKETFYQELTGVNEPENGFYSQTNGAWTAYATYLTVKYDINSVVGSLFATASKINGTGTALAVYFDATDTYLGKEFVGTSSDVSYYRQKLTPIAGTRYVALVNKSTTEYAKLEEGVVENVDVSILSSQNHWNRKKVVWMGTSVSFGALATKSYAQEASNKLGFQLVNASVPGLAIHGQTGAGGIEPLAYGSSSLSIAEYAANGITIASNPVTPYVPGGSYNNYYTTWENVFTAENADADLWVFDVVPNNVDFNLTDWNAFDKTNWAYNDASPFENHRTTFLGALIFLMDKMYALNPNARMVLVLGSSFAYTSGKSALQNLVDTWYMPVIDIWGKSNTSPKSKLRIYSENGTNPHPSSFGHEVLGKMIANELKLIG